MATDECEGDELLVEFCRERFAEDKDRLVEDVYGGLLPLLKKYPNADWEGRDIVAHLTERQHQLFRELDDFQTANYYDLRGC